MQKNITSYIIEIYVQLRTQIISRDDYDFVLYVEYDRDYITKKQGMDKI